MPRIFKLAFILTLAAAGAGFPLSPARAGPHVLGGFPLLRQQHSLTCESSAASMATRGRILEGQIMSLLPRHPNPNLGFRGSPDGQQGTKLVDYGVYASPLQKVLLQYSYRSDVLMYATDRQIKSYIDRGWPVETWVTYALQRGTPRLSWAGGTQFFLVPHEHTVLVIGYDRTSVTANDPWEGKLVRYDWRNFNRAWGYFANMALAVQPCAIPQPVTHLHKTSLTPDGVTWSWNGQINSYGYKVKIIRHGDTDRVVYVGTQVGNGFTLAPILPGKGYEIIVTSLASCGATSTSRRAWAQVPSSFATPTPVPATPSATPSATPAAEPKPTATRTATG